MKFDKGVDSKKVDNPLGPTVEVPLNHAFLNQMKRHQPFLIGLLIFVLYSMHAFTLGPSDDEAYYWVLSHTFRFGYAFHPPMVAWMILLSRFLFDPFLPAIIVLRLPAVLCVGLTIYLFLKTSPTLRGLFLLLSFAGFFSASFMMVPDMPLYLGLAMMMSALYPVYLHPNSKTNRMVYVKTFFGLFICMLSKYSAVLWGPVLLFLGMYSKTNRRNLILVMFSGLFSALVILGLGFYQNGIGSLIYQFSERHSGAHTDFKRYFRFALLQLMISGPLFWTFILNGRSLAKNQTLRYGLLWASVPLFIFGIQPLWSDFKIHWFFAGLLPLFAMASVSDVFLKTKWATLQIVFGTTLLMSLVLATRFPIISLVRSNVLHADPNPLLDVSNDLHGYEALKSFFEQTPEESSNEEIIGGRYQTASQAAFVLVDRYVTMYPVSQKEAAEWPVQSSLIPITDHFRIIRPFYYVSDERYTALPVLSNGSCSKVFESVDHRFGVPGKAIYVHHCTPSI